MTARALWLVWLALAQPPGEILQRERNLGKAYYERGEYTLAVEAFERVIAREDASGRDYFNAGMAYLQNQQYDQALAALTTARQMEPALIEIDFGLGVLHKRTQRHPLAREAFQRVLARDPEDPCTLFNLGAVSFSMERGDEAEAAFERVLAIGHARGQNFYVSALFRYAGLLSRTGRQEEARALFAEFEALRQDTPNVALTPAGLENGRYGRVELPPNPSPVSSDRNPGRDVTFVPAFELPTPECDAGPAPAPALGDVDSDGSTEIFLPSPCGKNRLYRRAGGGGRLEDVTERAGLAASGRSRGALFFDFDNSGTIGLYLWSSVDHRLYRNEEGGRFEDVTESAALESVSPPITAVALDADNDGQLDLFFGGPDSRLSLLRNDGDGTFTETLVPLSRDIPPAGVTHVAAADFDQDGFTDVLVAREGDASPLLLANEGDGFRATALPFSGPGGKGKIDLMDFDRDSWIDAIVSSSSDSEAAPRFVRNRIGRLSPFEGGSAVGGSLVPIDVDGDGATELLFSGGRLLTYRLEGGFEETAVQEASAVEVTGSAIALDLEGKGDVTLLLPGNDGRTRALVRPRPEGSSFVRLALTGKRTNRQAVGATVELKAGRFYQKTLYPGYPVTLFTGTRDRLDVLRIGWTNGVIQNEMEVGTGITLSIEEEERQTSSCPFLYLWDGTRFRFLTDVVGRAPLGEVLPDGSFLSPHPEDYVRIPTGAMAARDGELLFQVTEELRETAYLDAVELVAVDRPPQYEVFVDEKFSSPPFEPFRLYVFEKRQPPVRAIDARSRDVLHEVGRRDGVYVSGIERHPVSGFAREHVLELTAPSNLETGDLLLFLSGWVYWPGSSSMKALSANETFAPHPPRLEVPDGEGGWLTAIEELGLPSGIGRTLIADVSNLLPLGDRRLRIVTNIEVYWDEAFFATASRESGLPIHRLAPLSADLHFRGFSRVERRLRSEPERYDYESLLAEAEAPWNATAGTYTRYGERRDRIADADGELVVMAPGDELTLHFDPRALPAPRGGLERDWFLHFTGWAKDQDPNTRHSRTVEPLPVSGPSSEDEDEDEDEDADGRYVPALVTPLAPPSALAEPAERKERVP